MSRKASGFKAWVLQRVSAMYLGIYFVYLLVYFSMSAPQSHAELTAWLSAPVVGISMALFFLSLLLHAWIGIRDVVIDYVHPLAIRLTVLTLIALLLLACAFSVLSSLIVVAM